MAVTWKKLFYDSISAASRILGRKTAGAGFVEELTGAEVTGMLSAATTAAAGIIEIAIGSEVDTGTDATRAISPDALAGSNFGKRVVSIKVFDDATALTTGDNKFIFVIPVELNGMNLVQAEAAITTVSSSGLPSIALRNVTDTTNPLTTDITIDATEFTSYTAVTRSVVNASFDDFVTGDRIAVDVDAVGTGSKGLIVYLTFQLP